MQYYLFWRWPVWLDLTCRDPPKTLPSALCKERLKRRALKAEHCRSWHRACDRIPHTGSKIFPEGHEPSLHWWENTFFAKSINCFLFTGKNAFPCFGDHSSSTPPHTACCSCRHCSLWSVSSSWSVFSRANCVPEHVSAEPHITKRIFSTKNNRRQQHLGILASLPIKSEREQQPSPTFSTCRAVSSQDNLINSWALLVSPAL